MLGLLLTTVTLPVMAEQLSTGMKFEKHEVLLNEEGENVVPAISTRIINGSQAKFDHHPHYVAMTVIPPEMVDQNSFSYIKNCGGMILNDKFVLTAAHCVEDMVYTEINNNFNMTTSWRDSHVLLGVSRLSDARFSNFYKVKTRHIHPDYGTDSFFVGDIAILELERTITHDVDDFDYNSLNPSVYTQMDNWYAAGMGKQGANAPSTDVLLETRIEPGNDFSGYCANVPYKETTLCSIDGSGYYGATCQGDSGGPLSFINNGKHVPIGLVSYGTDPCGSGYTVFTEIASYLPWINSIVTSGNELDYIHKDNGVTDIGGGDNNDNGFDGDDGDDGGSNGILTLLMLSGLLIRKKNKK